ncbi:MAG: hypothetical protein QOF67_3383 [Mycobacterium sp.]|nr:hypothetical protein [Mycobacterium sp.]
MPGRRRHPRSGPRCRPEPRSRSATAPIWPLDSMQPWRLLRRRPTIHRRRARPSRRVGLRRARRGQRSRRGVVAWADEVPARNRRPDSAQEQPRSQPRRLPRTSSRPEPLGCGRTSRDPCDGAGTHGDRSGSNGACRSEADGFGIAAPPQSPGIMACTPSQQGPVWIDTCAAIVAGRFRWSPFRGRALACETAERELHYGMAN